MADSKFPLTSTGAAMAVATSALRAQQARMRIIAENLANADSTSKTAGGDPYQRQIPVFQPQRLSNGIQGVQILWSQLCFCVASVKPTVCRWI